MHSIKGSWVGQTFALAKRNESEGRKARIRRSKGERKDMVVIFIKKYQKINDGKFPSLSLTHRECGGSFYTIREIVREVIQENRVLGPAKWTSKEEDNDQLFEQFPVGTIATEPQSSSFVSSNEDMLTFNHNQVASEESVLNSDSICVGLANSTTSKDQDTDQILEQLPSVTIPMEPEHHFSVSSNGYRPLSDQSLGTSEEPVLNADCVGLEEEPQRSEVKIEDNGSIVDVKTEETSSLNSTESQTGKLTVLLSEGVGLESESQRSEIKKVNESLVGLKVDESSNINSEELQTGKHTELLSDGVGLDAELQRSESKNEVTRSDVDVKMEDSSDVNSEEVQTEKQTELLSDGVDLEAELQRLESKKEVARSDVDVKIEESSDINSAESQTGKQTELISDGVGLEVEPQRSEIEIEVNRSAMDVKMGESCNINSAESQTGKQTELISDSVGLEEEPPSLKSKNRSLVDVKIEESSNTNPTSSQSGKETETRKIVKDLAKLKAKIADIPTNVTVETFPIVRPVVTKPVNGSGLKSSELKELTVDGKSAMHDNGNLQLPGNGVVVSNALEQSETTLANATNTPSGTNKRSGNISASSRTMELTKKVKPKPVFKQSSSLQNGSKPTLDRINLRKSWKDASKQTDKAESNPLFSVFKSFIEAFVKFWSE